MNLLYTISPDRKHCFGLEKKQIIRFKMVYFLLGRYRTNQLIRVSEFPVIYDLDLRRGCIFDVSSIKNSSVLKVSSFPELKVSAFRKFVHSKLAQSKQ
jgi:hypothetical protein